MKQGKHSPCFLALKFNRNTKRCGTKARSFFEKPTACSPAVWKALFEKGYLEKLEIPFNVQSWQEKLAEQPICNSQNRLTLNKQQTLVVSRLHYQQGFGAFLLNGVTGSGKTEVYLQVIEEVLKRGEQVLVLVPEIGLTPQTIQRFQARFNVEIDALHSHLNDTQRLNAWLRAKNGESAIVIGTQMLAKGHHFPNVTLVAIVNVDSSLFSTDYRAEERLAQLYVQVSGRAGRAEKQGEVVLQTHYPDHPLLTSLLNDGYLAFASQALAMRKIMSLPPFSSQVLIRTTGRDSDKVANFLQDLTACLQQIIGENDWQGFQLLGPFNAPMAKKAGHYRWQLLIQHSARSAIQQLLDRFDEQKEQFLRNDVRLTVDIDPQELG
ncbi:helicase conserved C-terminal domain protein [Glaesserella parasuis SW114]|nr:helicase conserved C-terminal domain protein [Glaesserella parasuis SW114]